MKADIFLFQFWPADHRCTTQTTGIAFFNVKDEPKSKLLNSSPKMKGKSTPRSKIVKNKLLQSNEECKSELEIMF